MSTEPYIVIVSDRDAEVTTYQTLNQVIDELKRLTENERENPVGLRVTIVQGKRAFLTKGQFKFLVTPDGKKHELFGYSTEPIIDEGGFLVEPVTLSTEGKDDEMEHHPFDEGFGFEESDK